MLENRPHLKFKNNATSFSDIFRSEQNWASYGVFVKTDDARTMLGCRTPFSFCLCISFKLSPALNLYLQHKLPTNCSSLPKHLKPAWTNRCTVKSPWTNRCTVKSRAWTVSTNHRARKVRAKCWSANHRAQKVPGERGERIDIMKALYFVEQL